MGSEATQGLSFCSDQYMRGRGAYTMIVVSMEMPMTTLKLFHIY